MVGNGALIQVCRLGETPYAHPAIAAFAVHELHMRAQNQARGGGQIVGTHDRPPPCKKVLASLRHLHQEGRTNYEFEFT